MRAAARLYSVTALWCVLAFPATAQTATPPGNVDAASPNSTTAGQTTAGAAANATTATSSTSAMAQPQTADSGTTIGDIVVTAQRRSENLQRVAAPVSVITSDAIVRQNITSPSQLSQLAPALQSTTVAGQNSSFFIRGVGTFVSNSYTDPAIAFNYNGVYISRPSATDGFFYDLDRVEVLKGPQGTLYGRNATGGALNVIPAPPKLNETSGFILGSYSNYNSVNGQAAINLPLGPNAALRIAGQYIRHDGYMTHGFDDANNYGGRVQLLFQPTETLRVRVEGDYFHQGGVGQGGTVIGVFTRNTAGTAYSYAPTGLSSHVSLIDDRTDAVERSVGFAPITRIAHNDNQYWGVTAEANLDTSFGTITILPAYRAAQPNYYGASTDNRIVRDDDRQTSVELRAASRDNGPFRWLLGSYYLRETVDAYSLFAQQSQSTYQPVLTGITSLAAFGRATYEVAHGFRLTAGARYTEEKKYINGSARQVAGTLTGCRPCSVPFVPDFNQLINPAYSILGRNPPSYTYPQVPGLVLVTPAIRSVDQDAKFHAFTYRLAAEYDVALNNLLYASYETGYRSGGFFITTGDPTYQPERIGAFTVGSKNRFLDGRLQANLELFYWRYRNQQVSHPGTDPNLGSQIFITENVGRSTNKGAELELVARPFRNTTLTGDVQYLDAVYNSYTYTNPAAGGLPNTDCVVTRPVAGGPYSVNCSGQQALKSPKWTVQAGLRQAFPLGSSSLTFDGQIRYQTSQYSGTDFLAIERTPSFTQTDMSLTYGPNSKQWSLAAFATNLENKRQAASLQYRGVGAGAPYGLVYALWTPPRVYGVRGSVRF